MFRALPFIICVLFLTVRANAQDISHQTCSVENAIYKPTNSYDDEKEYVLRIEKGELGNLLDVSYFFWIELFDRQTKNKISAMRLGNSCSKSPVDCLMSAQYGQFKDLKNLEMVESSLEFSVLLADQRAKPLSDLAINRDIVPYYIILPQTHLMFRDNEKFAYDYGKYTKFYSNDNVFPSFNGKEIWQFSYCMD